MKIGIVLSTAAIALLASPATTGQVSTGDDYPFHRFVGTWKLKDDRFQQVWDGSTVETLSIPGHRTECAPVNTAKTVLCIVDAVDFQGHILWAIDDKSRSVSHLSHFGEARLGHGSGQLTVEGDLELIIRFSDEPEGSSRNYSYTWISANEYTMRSVQHDENGEATGNWYSGTFVRTQQSE